jgi:hypothetical protein
MIWSIPLPVITSPDRNKVMKPALSDAPYFKCPEFIAAIPRHVFSFDNITLIITRKRQQPGR